MLKCARGDNTLDLNSRQLPLLVDHPDPDLHTLHIRPTDLPSPRKHIPTHHHNHHISATDVAMDFELPSPEELSALERDAQEWPDEFLDDEVDDGTWRTSRVSHWLVQSAQQQHLHTTCLRDSPLLGFYDDPTVDYDLEQQDDDSNVLKAPGFSTTEADARLLRAMASCPNLRDGDGEDLRLMREDWRREKAIRTLLEVQEADRRRQRDAQRHQVCRHFSIHDLDTDRSNKRFRSLSRQSDPYVVPPSPPPSPVSVTPTPYTSRPVSRVIFRAQSQEWRKALYGNVLEEAVTTCAETEAECDDRYAVLRISAALIPETDMDPRSITPTPNSVTAPIAAELAPALALTPPSLSLVTDVTVVDVTSTTPTLASHMSPAHMAAPGSPLRHRRPAPILVPDRSSMTTPTGIRESVLGAFPVPPSTPISAGTLGSRARSGSAGTTNSTGSVVSTIPTPALSLSMSSPSASESRFDDWDDDDVYQGSDHTQLSPPSLPFLSRKTRWSFGASKVSLSSAPTIDVPPVPTIASPRPARSAPTLLERATRRLSTAPRGVDEHGVVGAIAFPVQRSPSKRKSYRPMTGDSSSHRSTIVRDSSFLSEDPFASTPRSSILVPMSPTATSPFMLAPPAQLLPPVPHKRRIAKSFSNFFSRPKKASLSPLSTGGLGAFMSGVTSPKSAVSASPAPSKSLPSTPSEHVLCVTGLPAVLTAEEDACRLIGSWATDFVRATATHVRRRTDENVYVFFKAGTQPVCLLLSISLKEYVADVYILQIEMSPRAHVPGMGDVSLSWTTAEVDWSKSTSSASSSATDIAKTFPVIVPGVMSF
jgi:hypothetical protein